MKKGLILSVVLLSVAVCCSFEEIGSEGGIITPSLTPFPKSTVSPSSSWVDYDVLQTFGIRNDGPSRASKITLTAALIQSIKAYQDVLSWEVDAPAVHNTVLDEYGNQYAKFDFHNIEPGQRVDFTFHYRVRAYERRFDLGDCAGQSVAGFLDPEPYIESDAGEIVALAAQLSEGAPNFCERARVIYDYVANTLTYSGYEPDDKGALYALETKSGDCTEYTDLLIALCRSAGIPSRYVDGVTVTEGEKRHSWAQIHVPGVGWVPVDATWGRWPDKRDIYFAGITPDHVIVVLGRNTSILNSYHYWTYHYWWDGADEPTIVVEADWVVSPVDQ